MSLDDYFESDMYKAESRLGEYLYRKEEVDWSALESELEKIPDINVAHNGDTILSELFHDCDNGKILVKLLKLFLKHGYDVKANGGLNGSECLHQLCWATFDKQILDAAKILLINGAQPNLPIYGDEGSGGVIESIHWRLSGDWGRIGNIFEAYYEIIKAYDEGKDYQSIGCFSDCVGLSLEKVELIDADNSTMVQFDEKTVIYDSSLVMWLGGKALIVRPWIDVMVNPVAVSDSPGSLEDISNSFSRIIGAKLIEFVFIDPGTMQMKFDNGYCALFTNITNEESASVAACEVREFDDSINLTGMSIENTFLYRYAEHGTHGGDHDEFSVGILCGDKAFIIHSIREEGHRPLHMHTIECSPAFLEAHSRHMDLGPMKIEKAFFCNWKISAYRLKVGDKYLYLFSNNGYNDPIRIRLSERKITSYKELINSGEIGEPIRFYRGKKPENA